MLRCSRWCDFRAVTTLLFIALLSSPNFHINHVFADVGDYTTEYADLSGNCPAVTTCPLICSANITTCPVELQQCPDNLTLCADGSCAKTCDELLHSPCEYKCAPIACARIVDYYDDCLTKYKEQYEYAEVCGEEEFKAKTKEFTFTEWPFLALYFWISIVTVLMLLYSVFNQRLFSVDGSTKPIDIPRKGGEEFYSEYDNEDEASLMTQTAYKVGIIGSIVYVLVLLTLVGIHVLLAVFIILYYQQQGVVLVDYAVVFEDEVQVLYAFQFTWIIGFIWSFGLKWPYSIRSLFLRRCCFKNAKYVAVFAPTTKSAVNLSEGDKTTAKIQKIMRRIGTLFHKVMVFIFSDLNRSKEDIGEIKFCKVHTSSDDGRKYFYYNLRRYIYNVESDKFVPGNVVVGTTIKELCNNKHFNGLTSSEVDERSHTIGPNQIELHIPNPLRTLGEVFSSGFYVYQSFFIWSWIPLWYYHMAIVWSIVSIVSALSIAYSKYRSEENLFRLSQMSGNVQVIRQEMGLVTISHKNLVPGDVIVLKPGITYCDMVVLKHTKLVLDESAITGESNPISKVSIDSAEEKDLVYNEKIHKQCTILAGTTILEASGTEDDVGLVTKTASFTVKGEMLRDILSYERHQFKFDTEVRIILLILLVWACIAYAITYHLIQDKHVYGFFYGIYVFASALPPLLPTVFVASVGISEKRLAEKYVTCTNSEAILVAGKVNKALFDKTGTLTKQGLDFHGTRNATFFENANNSPSNELSIAMACCHTLTNTDSGDLIGNFVDRMMFDAIGATQELGSDNFWSIRLGVGAASLRVLKRFEFDHHRMTQSVIVQNSAGKIFAYVKGSAESIKAKSKPESLPSNFDDVVRTCAKEGMYQISFAYKELHVNTFTNLCREEIETNLSFIGSIDFKNFLRDETPSVIKELKEGNVSPVMVTGDNVLTGIHIARECGMIKQGTEVLLGIEVMDNGSIRWVDELNQPRVLGECKEEPELALLGSTWSALFKNHTEQAFDLVDHVKVFGRCTPQEKVMVVSALNKKGFITSMCGDGGNDCGALKTAHVGIALSEAEASIVSPFTSLEKSILSVLYVLKEGRCALASAMQSYKYMLMYGQVTTLNQMVCAYYQITFGDWCWVFMDGIWMLSMALCIPYSQAQKKLGPGRPTASLLGSHTMFSFLGVFSINIAFLFLGLAALNYEDFYQCRKWDSTDVSSALTIGDNYESTVIFAITGYQYVSAGLTYNFGYSFRAPWQQNYRLLTLALLFTIIHFIAITTENAFSCLFRMNCVNENVPWTIMVPILARKEPYRVNNPFNNTVMPVPFRWKLVVIVVVNTFLTMVYEYFIVNGIGKIFTKQPSKSKKLSESERTTETLRSFEKDEEMIALMFEQVT